MRAQWTEAFDDDALAALGKAAPGIRCLDAAGTAVTADAVARFLSARVRDDSLGGAQPTRRLAYVNARYTAGPKAALDALPGAWEFAAVELVV